MLTLMAVGMVRAVVACPATEDFQTGYECGKAFSKQFNSSYRLPIVTGVFVLCLLGAVTGILPGTKKR